MQRLNSKIIAYNMLFKPSADGLNLLILTWLLQFLQKAADVF